MSDGDEESYEVERILYQRDGLHPETRKPTTLYLVKWENYPEEQCTWEPSSSFNGNSIFNAWAQQWESGDVLDPIDLQRVEAQMAAFNVCQASGSAEDGSEPDPDTENLIAPESGRSPKRQKLVHDAPLITKRSRGKKGIARPIAGQDRSSGSPERTKPSSSRPNLPDQEPARATGKPVRSRSTVREPERARTAAPPLHRPVSTRASGSPRPLQLSSTPRRVPAAGNLLAHRPDPVRPGAQPASRVSIDAGSPSKFHMPDIQRRKRADKETRRTQTGTFTMSRAENNKGKPFRNWQHLNSTKKKLEETRQQHVLPPTVPTAEPVVQFAETPLDESSTDGHPTVPNDVERPASDEQMDVEVDASRLFFSSDSDDDVKQKTIHTDEDSLLRTIQAERRDAPQMLIEEIPQHENLKNERPRTTGPVTHPEASPSPPHDNTQPKLALDMHSSVLGTTIQQPKGVAENAAEEPAPRLATAQKEPEPIPRNAVATDGNIHPDRQRRKSLINQQLPAELRSTHAPQIPATVIPVQSTVESPFLPEARKSLPNLSSAPPTGPTRQNYEKYNSTDQIVLFNDDGVTREIIRGDVLCHLMCKQTWVGAVKLMHATHQYRQKILFSRGKKDQHQKLLLHFDEEMTRTEYDQRSRAAWFSYYDMGTFEPLEDSAPNFMALAHYLEKSSSALFWSHPSENLMGVLYPCNNPKWHDLGVKPGRILKARLCVAFRPKFAEEPVQPPVVPAVVFSKSPLQATDPRIQSVPFATKQDQGEDHTHEPVRAELKPKDYAAETEDRCASAPAVQKVAASSAQTQNQIAAADNDAMDVDEPTEAMARLNTLVKNIEPVAAPVQPPVSSFPGIDRSLKDLSSVPRPSTSKRKISILLAYNSGIEDSAQQVKNWLISNEHPWDQILDATDREQMEQFRHSWKKSICVILFDKRYQINHIEWLSTYVIRSDHMLCWQFDYKATTISQLGTRKLFPAGHAICISEACYTTMSALTLDVLKWLRHYVREVQKSYAASVLVLPPKIITRLLDEAKYTQDKAAQKMLRDLAALIFELMTLQSPSFRDACDKSLPSHGGFQVIETEWLAVYKNISETQAVSLADIKQQLKNKEGNLNVWFSAWALQNLDRHRKFHGVRAVEGTAPGNANHIKWEKMASFKEYLFPPDAREQLHDRERGRATTNQDDERARSRSLSIGSTAAPTPRTPAARY